LNDLIDRFFDVLMPVRELAYVYPLLILNWLNWLTGLAFSPVFYEPSRFDFVLGLTYSAIIVIGIFRSIRERDTA
jgi:hypothetical protein